MQRLKMNEIVKVVKLEDSLIPHQEIAGSSVPINCMSVQTEDTALAHTAERLS